MIWMSDKSVSSFSCRVCSFAKCSKQAKAIGTDKFSDIVADTWENMSSFTASTLIIRINYLNSLEKCSFCKKNCQHTDLTLSWRNNREINSTGILGDDRCVGSLEAWRNSYARCPDSRFPDFMIFKFHDRENHRLKSQISYPSHAFLRWRRKKALIILMKWFNGTMQLILKSIF